MIFLPPNPEFVSPSIRTTDSANLLGETTSRCYTSSVRVNTLLTPHGCSSFPVLPPSLFDPSSVFFDSLSPWTLVSLPLWSPRHNSLFWLSIKGRLSYPTQHLPVFWVRVFRAVLSRIASLHPDTTLLQSSFIGGLSFAWKRWLGVGWVESGCLTLSHWQLCCPVHNSPTYTGARCLSHSQTVTAATDGCQTVSNNTSRHYVTALHVRKQVSEGSFMLDV